MSRIIKATRVSLGEQVELDTPIVTKVVEQIPAKRVIEKKEDEDIEPKLEVEEVKEEPKSKEEIEMIYMEEARKKSELFFEEEMKKAYDEGIKKAELDANEMITNAQNQFNQILEESRIEAENIINEAIEIKNKITEEYKESMKGLENDVIELVIEIVERVLVKEVKKNDYIIGVVSEALEKLASKKDAILKVADVDYEFILENKENLLLNVEGFGDVQVIKESSLEAGSCIVESSFGIIDGSIKTRIMQIEKEVQKILNR